jgi:iron complex transport system substrate-binding protein
MKKSIRVYAGLLAAASFIAAALFFASPFKEVSLKNKNDVISCNKIVSLAPNITEMLFALGLDNRIVGVTDFCRYPAGALEKNKIGGYSNPSYELIADENPDVVFLLNLHKQQNEQLKKLGINSVSLNADNLSGIYSSILQIGDVCNVRLRGEKLVSSIKSELEKIGSLTVQKSIPSVLISVGRNRDDEVVKDVFAAGSGTFFNEVTELAGGRNVVSSSSVMYPKLSLEGIISLNPQVIIDIAVDLKGEKPENEVLLRQWQSAECTDAVKNRRVYVVSSDYASIPGPRIVLLVKEIATLLHPDINWDNL